MTRMETWDALRSRRNVRQYEDRPIPQEDLDAILEAGRRSPSAGNRQRWDFIVCTDRSQLQELSRVWRGAQHVAGSAATVALIAPSFETPQERESVQYDLGQATMSMMLLAADRGVGSGHAWVTEQDLARSILGFPADRFCAWLIAFGYPADGPLRPLQRFVRRPIEEVVHWGHWGGKRVPTQEVLSPGGAEDAARNRAPTRSLRGPAPSPATGSAPSRASGR
jgi:nitroreductase